MLVATVLTVYGIETGCRPTRSRQLGLVATVLTVYGIETYNRRRQYIKAMVVATVLTVYGIETLQPLALEPKRNAVMLQQYLPFTVLKLMLPTKYE